jgi:membrane associated rhomboid family serine protease
MIIPHSSDLTLGRRPYVTWAVIAICLLIHLIAPSSDALMYYPDSWNPIKMLTASVAHGSWSHIIGNLLFFYAFSPMLETAVASTKRYVLILIALALITHLTYSLYSLAVGDYVPTLGLSGVVMGVIGLAAYMMPRVHIRTFVWFITHAKNYYIPAWILAAWYIGWDISDLFSYGLSTGVNLISHVSGGIGGYLIGYYYLKDHKNEIKEEISDAIDYARSERVDYGMASTYSGGRAKMIEQIRERDAKRDYENYLSRIYQLAQANRESDAVVLALDGFEEKQYSVEIYTEMFERINDWGPSRTLLCTGRLCIDLFMRNNNFHRALEISKRCIAVTDDFLIADPIHVQLLAKHAIETNQHDVAYTIIKNAAQRYGDSINMTQCVLLEIELLWMHQGDNNAAKKLLTKLLSTKLSKEHHNSIMQLAKAMQS